MIFSFKKIFYATAFSTLLAGSAFADAVTVVSWGGSYGKAQDAALFTDASRDSGIAINRESGASMSKVMLQVESGAVIWDLVVTGSGGAANAAKKSQFRTSIKNVLKSISEKNADQSKKDFITAVSCIDKLAAKGIIHKNKAARHKARLNSKIKSL